MFGIEFEVSVKLMCKLIFKEKKIIIIQYTVAEAC